MTATPTDQPPANARRNRIIRIAQVGFSVAIVVAIFAYAIPKFASSGAVWAVLQRLTWPSSAGWWLSPCSTWSPTGCS